MASLALGQQLPFDLGRSPEVAAAVAALGGGDDVTERGAVFTRIEVVAGILDLVGYTTDRDLYRLRLLEPSCGAGDFLVPAVCRLLDAWLSGGGRPGLAVASLADAVRAVEVHGPSLSICHDRLVEAMLARGLTASQAEALCDAWLVQDDFLLVDDLGRFEVVVGNPPYVRQERIPAPLLGLYRERFATLYDRADLYVLFYERCLDWLADEGQLGFICANRWAKNKYGGPLREKIANGYALDAWIDLEGADAFDAVVDAYPAVTVLRRGASRGAAVVSLAGQSLAAFVEVAAEVRQQMRLAASDSHPKRPSASVGNERPPVPSLVRLAHGVANGRDPWLLDAPEILSIIRDLEERLPTIEASGASVGIGVASGADNVFIGPYETLNVEQERRLPLVMASDFQGVTLDWRGRGIVNPWMEDGTLAPMGRWPGFDAWIQANEARLTARHVAKKSGEGWYRTIDRITPSLTQTPKLLIPDIKGDATVVFDEGRYYPHHNLYVVTSEIWDLRALQALLRSSFALVFVAAYCVRMSGGYLRFQAQYLRRIRVPAPHLIPPELMASLAAVSTSERLDEIDDIAREAYGLDRTTAACLMAYAAKARVTA